MSVRVRLLNILRRESEYRVWSPADREYVQRDFTDPAVAAQEPRGVFWDMRGFGNACTYELLVWLGEHGLTNPDLEAWTTQRDALLAEDARRRETRS